MGKSLFVGSFPYDTTAEELSTFFRKCGKVIKVKILVDRATGRSRGMGFVEMSTEAEARAAMSKLDGAILGLRKIFVSEARPQEKRQGGSAGRPGFVERRSGKDRRRAPSGGRGGARPEKPAGEGSRREDSFKRKKRWKKRPAFGGDPKSDWGGKSGSGGDTRKGARGKKKWGRKPGRPSKRRPWEAQPEGRFGKKKGRPPKKRDWDS